MKHIYSFSGFGGFMNCSDCDDDTMVMNTIVMMAWLFGFVSM
jgi:hypothetical protein